jgi:hypothetical protein
MAISTFTYNGIDYRINRHRTHGRFVNIPVEAITSPVVIDQGTMVARTETFHNGAINPRTWAVRLADGTSYIESRNANVRVWINEVPQVHPALRYVPVA